MQVAIVIPVLNQLAYTQGCLRGLAPDIAMGVRVIIVDNGSADGTPEWLAGRTDIVVLRNEENRGCARAWNQGVAAASGADWVVVLNNDVLLPSGWLQALLTAAERHGLDIACPAMRERAQDYAFEPYATEFTRRLNNVVRYGAAHGVCFAVRRRVFKRIGAFDEGFRIGQFEDKDFFRRARLAGFRLGVVGSCFIHHFGSVTQDSLSDSKRHRPYEAEARAHFRQKWKLGWWQRRREKAGEKLRAFWWRTTERLRFSHTLHEKGGNGRVRYY